MQSHVLNAVGIQTWSQTGSMPGAKQVFNYQLYELLDSNNQQVGLLLLEKIALTAETEKLLDAMLKAVKLSKALSQQQLEQCLQAQIKFALVLGKLASLDFADIPVIQTYHPNQLAAQPQLKREAWQQLQQIGGIV